LEVDLARVDTLPESGRLSEKQNAALVQLQGRRFLHAWELDDELAKLSDEWRAKPATIQNEPFNSDLRARLERLHRSFATELPAVR
jgi:hypothetical protein